MQKKGDGQNKIQGLYREGFNELTQLLNLTFNLSNMEDH